MNKERKRCKKRYKLQFICEQGLEKRRRLLIDFRDIILPVAKRTTSVINSSP